MKGAISGAAAAKIAASTQDKKIINQHCLLNMKRNLIKAHIVYDLDNLK
jgi:hypothetical protein